MVPNETSEKQPPLVETPMTHSPEQFAMKDVPVTEVVILENNHDLKMEKDEAAEADA